MYLYNTISSIKSINTQHLVLTQTQLQVQFSSCVNRLDFEHNKKRKLIFYNKNKDIGCLLYVYLYIQAIAKMNEISLYTKLTAPKLPITLKQFVFRVIFGIGVSSI